jgi:hypothetical protein
MKPDTWSNIAYVILGVMWLIEGHITLSIYAIILGLTSGYSHHTRDWLPDWAGMYLLFSGLILNLLGLPMILALIPAILTYVVPKHLLDNFAVIGTMFAFILLLTPNWIIVSSIFAVAFAFRQYGEYNRKYHQAFHSIWHLITAIGFYFI